MRRSMLMLGLVAASLLPGVPGVHAVAADGGSPIDGTWSTGRVTRDDLAATLARSGMDPADAQRVGPHAGYVDALGYALWIQDGRWQQHELSDGVDLGPTWDGPFTITADGTVTSRDEASGCELRARVAVAADTLTVDLLDETCANPDDLAVRTATLEARPFRLVQAPDWDPTALAPASPAASPGPAAVGPSTSRDRMTLRPAGSVPGAPLGYLEYLPPDPPPDAGSPLLLFLHGSGQSGPGTADSLVDLVAAGIPAQVATDRWPDDRPFIVLAPQHDRIAPAYCFTVDEIDAFLAFALEHYPVDPSRIDLVGLSCGATAGWNELAAHPDGPFAAAVLIAGNGVAALDRAGCALARVPVWAFHGADDPIVPVYGSVDPVTQLRACTPAPADARVTVYPGAGHDVWSRTFDLAGGDIHAWLLSHARE